MMDIAIVGSGIAGLAAAWQLGARHRVTLYEKQSTLGMAAQGLEWGGARVDMPLRVLYRGYYPSLTALYADADIATVAADYSGSFSNEHGDTYFRYGNWQGLPGLSLPYLSPAQWRSGKALRIGAALLRLYARARRDQKRLQTTPMSLQRYLEETGYSHSFCEAFLLPTFAAIATCDIDAVREYPASVIIEYLNRGVLLGGVQRTVRGADHVVQRLASRCAELKLEQAITTIRRTGTGVMVQTEKGSQQVHDHVIMATQANQSLRIIDDLSMEEADTLKRFRYQPSEVIVHTDDSLMPRRRRDWSPVNFEMQAGAPRPMATIWLNAVLPVAKGHADAFQTWNPLREPAKAHCLARARFERPIVDAQSQRGLERLKMLHAEPERRLWFCGSYAETGVPLLESAARSAAQVARAVDGA